MVAAEPVDEEDRPTLTASGMDPDGCGMAGDVEVDPVNGLHPQFCSVDCSVEGSTDSADGWVALL